MKLSPISLYDKLVLGKPVATLLLVFLITAFFGWFVPDLRIDISSDSLVLEKDEDLRYRNETRAELPWSVLPFNIRPYFEEEFFYGKNSRHIQAVRVVYIP